MISFHYMNKGMLYALDFLIYHLRPFGLVIGDAGGDAGEGGLLEYAKQRASENSMPISKPVVVDEPEAKELANKLNLTS